MCNLVDLISLYGHALLVIFKRPKIKFQDRSGAGTKVDLNITSSTCLESSERRTSDNIAIIANYMCL